MNKRYISLIFAVVIIGSALYLYGKMGGFSKTTMAVVSSSEYIVAGKPFKGFMKTQAFGKLFEEADTFIIQNNLKDKAWVCGIFYNNPPKDKDTLIAFVGAIVKDTMGPLKPGYSYRRIPARKVIRASINAHYLFAPSIYPDIEKYAEENKIQSLQVPAIEIYPREDEVVVEVPVK
ncbi:MAG: GyrI-like domain-containing protein [Cytophagaceae bacterium]